MENTKKILFVDLDGTFLLNDLFISTLKKRPWLFFLIFKKMSLIYLKNYLFKNIDFEKQDLKLNEIVFQFIEENKHKYSAVNLISASPQKYIDYVIERYPDTFNEGHGSNNNINLKGEKKVDFIKKVYGDIKFDYIGNSSVDQYIYIHCDRAYHYKNKKLIIWNS